MNGKYCGFYTLGPLNGWDCIAEGENNLLYLNGCSRTSMTPSDLPPWFVKVEIEGRDGFVPAAGAVSILYRPSFSDPLSLFRYDVLYVSYHCPLSEENGRITGADLVIHDAWIIPFIHAVRKYSPDCNTAEAGELLRKKARWLSDQLL